MAGALALLPPGCVTAQGPPQSPEGAQRNYTSHDYTSSGSINFLREVWTDVKVQGNWTALDGRTYTVGTIEVEDTLNTPMFSNVAIQTEPPSLLGFSIAPATRQVVVVQSRDPSQGILAQRFLYGTTPGEQARWSNARAISVWPAASSIDTRVAVCGATCDQSLPLNQVAGSLGSNAVDPTGFIAVYDGDLNLLWSYQFFGHDFTQRCTVTDLAIRVEQEGGTTFDVVTYCGLSSHGHPGGGTPLTPVLPFPAPIVIVGSNYTSAAGDTDNGAGEWDGFVGRLRHNRATGSTVRGFHSIVGGDGRDGLFGLAELDTDRFVVVGNTSRFNAAPSPAAFPLTESYFDWNNAVGATPNYSVATLTVFDAAPTRTGQPLGVLASHTMGRPGGVAGIGNFESMARDVWAAPVNDRFSVFVVGSTNDWTDSFNNFITACQSVGGDAAGGAQSVFGGAGSNYLFDGFVLHAFVWPERPSGSAVNFDSATFDGDQNEEGLTGVAGWSEFPLYCVASGYRTNAGLPATFDLTTTSFALGAGGFVIGPVRRDTIGGTLTDKPGALGVNHATTSPFLYVTESGNPLQTLADYSGGGVTLDPRGRGTIVGGGVVGGGPSFPVIGGIGARGGWDGIRAVHDHVPQGVWRTDGTGTRAAAFGAVPQPSPTTYDGGTTPVPCLSAFGSLPGQALPPVMRVLIDYLGTEPGMQVGNGMVTIRPTPPAGLVHAALMQVSFPSAPTSAFGSLTEFWTPTGPVTLPPQSGTPSQWPVFPGGMPTGSYEFTIQIVFLLSSVLPCDPGASLGVAASPGLVISY